LAKSGITLPAERFFDQNEEFEMLVSLGKDAHCRRTYIGRQADENEMIRQKTAVITAPLWPSAITNPA
jgi:hypothetical protein